MTESHTEAARVCGLLDRFRILRKCCHHCVVKCCSPRLADDIERSAKLRVGYALGSSLTVVAAGCDGSDGFVAAVEGCGPTRLLLLLPYSQNGDKKHLASR